MGLAWLKYDEMFRKRAAVYPSMPCDRKEYGLWTELVGQPIGWASSDSVYILIVGQGWVPVANRALQKDTPKQI